MAITASIRHNVAYKEGYMKYWFLLFCMALLPCSGCSTSGSSPSVVATRALSPQELFYHQYDVDQQTVLRVSSIAADCSVVKDWQANLLCLKPYLSKQLPELQGKTLHVVLQWHTSFTAGFDDPNIRQSQQAVLDRLTSLHPKLLTMEGSYLDRFTKASYMLEIDRTSDELDAFRRMVPSQPIPTEKEAEFTKVMRENAVLGYAYQHPECHAIGGEWRGVHSLDVIMMFPDAPQEAPAAFAAGSRLHSWLTAARAGEFMTKDGLTEATIVIGANHRQDFEALAKTFGVNIVFHETL